MADGCAYPASGNSLSVGEGDAPYDENSKSLKV